MKSNYNLPQPLLTSSDLTKLLNSDEIQVKKIQLDPALTDPPVMEIHL